MKLKFSLLVFLGCYVFGRMDAQVSPLEKADKQFELNNFEGAIKSYTQALETVENKSAIFARLGDASQKLGRANDAVQWYQKSALSGDAMVQFKLGKAFIAIAKYQEAKEVFKKIESKNSEAKHFIENCDFAMSSLPPSLYQVSNATALNTPADDFFASFTTNGSIVFLSSRTDMTRKAGKMPTGSNQLFSTVYSNMEFSKPEFFNSDLKNIFGEGPLAENGFQALITQNNFISGIRPMEQPGLELSLKKANLNPDGHWKTTQSVQLGGAGYSNAFASISDDGERMVFSSDRPGGQGGFDLYMCKKEGESWGVPINMGELNSAGNEITPFFAGESLFFSSDYLKGLGGFDIFRAEQTAGIYNEIFHLGNQINSASDDYGFIFDQQKGFGLFNSNRAGGAGGEDFYVAHRFATDFLFTILDEEANPLSEVKVDPSKCRYESGISDKNGKFKLQMAGESECTISFNKSGFIPQMETIKGNRGTEPVAVVITMKKAPVPYFGFVQDEDGLALEGVIIKATNTASQLKFEALTDSKGKYNLPLEAKSDYLIYFSKANFINLNINKKNLSATDLSLGTVKLRMTLEDPKPVQTPTTKSSVSTTQEKFTLQIASVSDKNTDLSAYKKALGAYGEVYMIPGTKGTYKIKVGKYATREEAVKAYEAVKKAGYSPIISTAINSVPQDEKQLPNELLKPDDTVYSDYVVRLCTLSKPENFDGSKIEHLGKLASMKNGAFTIFLLTNFKDLEAAKSARDKVQKAGFKDAFVVERKGNQLLKVE